MRHKLKSLLSPLSLCLLMACTVLAQAAPTSDIEPWGPADNKAFTHVLKGMKNGVTVTHDLSDDHAYRFVRRLFEASGFEYERYPGLYTTLAEARTRHQAGLIDAVTLTSVDEMFHHVNVLTEILEAHRVMNGALEALNSTPSYAAKGAGSADLSGDPHLVMNYVSTCFVEPQPNGSNKVLSCTPTTTPGASYLEAQNSYSGTAANVTAIVTGYYVHKPPGLPPQYFSQSQKIDLARTVQPSGMSVSEPAIVSGNAHNPSTVVCVSRQAIGNVGKGNMTCDYGNLGGAQLNVVFNLEGSVTYAANQSPKLGTNNLPDPTVSSAQISLVNHKGGGCQSNAPVSGNKFFQDVVVCPTAGNFTGVCYSATNRQLNWNLDDVDFGAAHYLKCGAAGDTLTFAQKVTVQDATDASIEITGTIASVSGVRVPTPEPGNPGVWDIPLIEMLSGCLAPGTLVELSDGSTKPIEKFLGETEMVRGGFGQAVSVTGTIEGTESRMFDIKVGNRSLKASANHPVVTEGRGIVLAESLRAGDRIIMRDGAATIRSVVEIDYEGPVYNLVLSDPRDPKTGRPAGGVFYANGFLVGDNPMQEKMVRARDRSTNVALDRLPEIFKTDYQSGLNDIAAGRMPYPDPSH